MRIFATRILAAGIALAALLVQPLGAADRADKREILKEARAAYYSLRRNGLESFDSTVDGVPNATELTFTDYTVK